MSHYICKSNRSIPVLFKEVSTIKYECVSVKCVHVSVFCACIIFLYVSFFLSNKLLQKKWMYRTCYLMVTHLNVCQILCAYVKEQRRSCPDTNSWQKYKFSILRSKVKVIQRSLIYATYRPTCQTWYIYAKGQKNVARTQSHVIKSISLTLRLKVNVVSGSWMYAFHGDRPMCQIW